MTSRATGVTSSGAVGTSANPAPAGAGVRRFLADTGLALVLLALAVVGTEPAGRNQHDPTPVDALAYGLAATAALALAVRRRYPLVTLALASAATGTYLVLGYPYGPIMAAYAVAVYTVAGQLPTRRAVVAAVAALAALLVHVFYARDGAPGLTGVLPASVWVVVPFALGVTVRLNRESAARARAELARRHADDERLRIAQEVHDVVGHGLAAINMQAEIALHLLPRRPEQAESALAAISRTSKEALDELRATLSVVRRDAERAPTPGLAQLETLRARLAAAGLPITLEVTGEARDLPLAVDIAAYRVVQESLTNVLRHAGAATATVTIRYEEAALTVEVTDTGRGAPPGDPAGRPGHGLAGMRERVDALGGELEAGPRAGGGFRVYARLPAEVRP